MANIFSTLQELEATIYYLDTDYYPGQVSAQNVANVQELINSCIKHLTKLQNKVGQNAVTTNSARRRRIRTNSSRLNSQLYGIDSGEYVDLSDAPHLYGYLIHSDISGLNVLVCADSKARLNRVLPEIKDMLIGDGSADWYEYAADHNLIIKTDGDSDDAFYENYNDETGRRTGEIFVIENGTYYAVDIIGEDRFRF